MKPENKQLLTLEKTARNLAAFAIDRNDLKSLLSAIPESSGLNLTTIEYELQILKILSVGWGISFYMPSNDSNKVPLSELFWENMRDISENISTLTQTTTGQDIDYFGILKTRLDTYLAVMKDNTENANNPAAVMGPAFADACRCKNDPVAVLTGTKMFTLTLGAVKEYLGSITIDNIKFN